MTQRFGGGGELRGWGFFFCFVFVFVYCFVCLVWFLCCGLFVCLIVLSSLKSLVTDFPYYYNYSVQLRPCVMPIRRQQ